MIVIMLNWLRDKEENNNAKLQASLLSWKTLLDLFECKEWFPKVCAVKQLPQKWNTTIDEINEMQEITRKVFRHLHKNASLKHVKRIHDYWQMKN